MQQKIRKKSERLTTYDNMYIDMKLGQRVRENSVKCPNCVYLFLLDEPNYNFNMVMEHMKRRHPEIYKAMIETTKGELD